MKLIKTSMIFALSLNAMTVFADDSAQHGSKATKHSALAASHAGASTAAVVSAAVAVPLIVVGSTGQLSTAAGESLLENTVSNQPLEITDKTITADPAPGVVMKVKVKKDDQ